jgi:DNA-binding beta-propeller fold protein YncE
MKTVATEAQSTPREYWGRNGFVPWFISVSSVPSTSCGLLFVFVCLAAGCTSTWTLRTARPDIALQWPYQPDAAKVTYVESLTGFTPNSNSGSVLRAIVIGEEERDRNAFVLPVAVATGHDGRIAVADLGRRCVHLYLPSQRRYVRLSGSEQEPIVSPVGVIFDDDLRLYLSDSVGKVFAFGADGALRFTLQTAGADKLQRPTGIAYSPGKQLLYVVDTLANKVQAFRTNGEFAFSFGERGDAEGRFNFPTHIFRSASGELYVADSLNFRIAIFDEEGKALGAFGHHGDGSGDMAMPKGVAVDKDGIVYEVDGRFDNVQLFNRKGDFLLTLGQRGVDFGEFWLPSGAFISDHDELYVCDTYNRRIQVFRITERYANGTS